jgi:tetratricopeptide (TPR) repeat protein
LSRKTSSGRDPARIDTPDRPAAAEQNRPAEREWFAVAVFGVALLVRLIHVWQIRRSPYDSTLLGDSRGYDDWARQLAGGDWLGHDVFYQAPLYPYLLGLIYRVAGHHLLIVRVVQALIGSMSCALLALAARRMFSRPAGIAAGLMLALYAPAIFFDGLLQKSVLDVFFVCLALWLISRTEETAETAWFDKLTMSARPEPVEGRVQRSQRSLRSPRFLLHVTLGLTMGGLALTRENALIFILVILAWILTKGLSDRGWRLAGRSAAAFLIGLAIVLLPVAARNSYVGGGFFITTSQFGPNFYIGNNPEADGTYQSLRFGRGSPEYERQDATELAERALGTTLTPAQVSSYWTDKALAFVTSSPGAWLALMGKKAALVWNATEMVDTESQEAHAEWSLPLRLGGIIGHFGILVPLAVFGVILTWPLRSRLWILYAMTLAYAASVVLFYVFARYRYPLVPLLILFAAAGVVALPGVIRSRQLAGGAWTLAAVAVTAAFCNWPMLSRSLMRAVTETNLGSALEADGRLDDAIEHYHRAIAFAPGFPPAYNNLATAQRAKGQITDAISTYQQALRLRSQYPEAEYNLGNALMDAGRTSDAVEHFQIALRTIPASVDVHNNLGIALMDQGKRDEAIAEFRAALALDPASVQSHLNLGNALGSAHQYDEAIEHFHRASQLNPADASSHYDLGSLLLEIDRLDDAIAEFRAALKIDPRSAKTLNNLGIALGSQGRMDEAIELFRRAIELQPNAEDAKRNLAMALRVRPRD